MNRINAIVPSKKPVLVHDDSKYRHVVLNRVSALNAVDYSVSMALQNAVGTASKPIIIRSNCPRAFCAGGDVKKLYFGVKDGKSDLAIEGLKLSAN